MLLFTNTYITLQTPLLNTSVQSNIILKLLTMHPIHMSAIKNMF